MKFLSKNNRHTNRNFPGHGMVSRAGFLIGVLIIFTACDKKDKDLEFSVNFSYAFLDDNHVQFSNASTGEYYSMFWNFGNGMADTTTDKNKTYIIYYPQAGNFNVNLQLNNYYGEKKSTNKPVAISNSDLVLSFSADVDTTTPNYVHLKNTSQGTFDSFKWLYRDVEVKNEMEHLAWFPHAGDYEIELVVNINNVDYSHSRSVNIAQDDPNIVTHLIWSEEFDYTGLPDPLKWNMETGGDGWGNEELQYYSNNESNASVANGILTITAREEPMGGRDYTSARITTQGKFDCKYGRVEARIKLPYGQGLWPAFWMLGANFSSAGWPGCGEIDIMEMVGGSGKDKTVYATLHWDNNGEHAQYGESYSLQSGIFADDYHLFSIEWNEQKITAFVDDAQYYEIDITPSGLSEFHSNFFIILNVAVGGTWPGPPNAGTSFPQTMEIDYVRVYQEDI
ncbi:MAG: family 16 glycosylhydrolase [Bacteroidales bacterium]|nr:family 16 glycosylhydrolase [Bacteroidales bacterium]